MASTQFLKTLFLCRVWTAYELETVPVTPSLQHTVDAVSVLCLLTGPGPGPGYRALTLRPQHNRRLCLQNLLTAGWSLDQQVCTRAGVEGPPEWKVQCVCEAEATQHWCPASGAQTLRPMCVTCLWAFPPNMDLILNSSPFVSGLGGVACGLDHVSRRMLCESQLTLWMCRQPISGPNSHTHKFTPMHSLHGLRPTKPQAAGPSWETRLHTGTFLSTLDRC